MKTLVHISIPTQAVKGEREMTKKSLLWSLASLLVLTSMLLSSCGAPATPAPTEVPATAAPATEPPATAAPATEAPAATAPATEAPAQTAAGPTCGTDPVVLNAYFETGFDIPFKLSEEFTKQFPNVTWDIKQDQFANLINETPRLLSGDKPTGPDPAADHGLLCQAGVAQEP
jgi:raffinose/stachyose/melibiose transport system substrate-binding protein